MTDTIVIFMQIQRFKFTDANCQFISKFMLEHAGINLPMSKRELIYGRLIKRLRYLNLNSFEDYCHILEKGDAEELVHCINSLTTNVTSFFRENHHFDYLSHTVLPEILSDKTKQGDKRLRIWSAGCSSGEEPYSIAMTVKQSKLFDSNWDVKILATDLDSTILEKAQTGIYNAAKLEGIPQQLRRLWFRKGRGEKTGLANVVDELKNMITFKQLNLAHENWPMRGLFDVIFCRNVVIYFGRDIRQALINRFADKLTNEGHLFIGHSESLFGISERFTSVGNTMHRKIA